MRASGPGGQNVNKVSNAVELRFDAAAWSELPDTARTRLRRIAGRRMTDAGLIVIDAQRLRSLEKNVNERTDSLSVRMTDVETQVQDATMDVSTAVQLDRLEEIERALIELDPSQFVRKDEKSQKTVKNSSADADALSDEGVPSAQYDGA